MVPPEADDPVEPLVPELLLVPALPVPLLEPDGVVDVELPEEPMPERVPDVDVPLSLGADELVDDGPTDPLAEPPVEPMPDAVPEAEPEAVVPQADRAAAAAIVRAAMVNFCM